MRVKSEISDTERLSLLCEKTRKMAALLHVVATNAKGTEAECTQEMRSLCASIYACLAQEDELLRLKTVFRWPTHTALGALLHVDLFGHLAQCTANDEPRGSLNVALQFVLNVLQNLRIPDRFPDAKQPFVQPLISQAAFRRVLVALLATGADFYANREELYVALAVAVAAMIPAAAASNPSIFEEFVQKANAEGSQQSALIDTLARNIPMGGKRGSSARKALVSLLRCPTVGRAVADFVVQHGDVAMIAAVALGAHFSALPLLRNLLPQKQSTQSSSMTPNSPRSLSHFETLPKGVAAFGGELGVFVAMLGFCQDLVEIPHERLQSHVCDHVEVYFVRGVFANIVQHAAIEGHASLLYYVSWIVRIVHNNALAEVLFRHFFASLNRGNGGMRLYAATSSDDCENNATPNTFFSELAICATSSPSIREPCSLSSPSLGSPSSFVAVDVGWLLLARLNNGDDGATLAALKTITNCFCYQPALALRHFFGALYDDKSYCAISPHATFNAHRRNVARFVNLLRTTTVEGAAVVQRFVQLERETHNKVAAKVALFVGDATFKQPDTCKTQTDQTQVVLRSDVVLGLLKVFASYWRNSVLLNVALTEAFYELLTVPQPIVYGALLAYGIVHRGCLTDGSSSSNNHDAEEDAEFCADDLFYRTLFKVAVDNGTVRTQLSKPRILAMLEGMPSNADTKHIAASRDKEALDFAQNYTLLTEFIKEIVCILQAHALQAYGALDFGNVK